MRRISNIFWNLLSMSITGSAVVGLMILLRPVTNKIFSAKWQYGIGKMAIVFFLLPVSLFTRKLPLAQHITKSYPTESSIIQEAVPSNGFVYAINTLKEKHLTIELMKVILVIWLVGALLFVLWHFYCYFRFTKQLRYNNFPVSDETTAIFSACKSALYIQRKVELIMNQKIMSPMLVGLYHPIILLPTSNIQKIDLKLVLTHELTHLKRKDLWVKMFALAAGTLHWFNPFVHILRKDIRTWGELSCDEVLASIMSHEEKIIYGKVILKTLDRHSYINTTFCSSLCDSQKNIKRRLTMLLNAKKMKKHIVVLAVIAILAIGGTGLALAASLAENEIDNVINVNIDKQAKIPTIEPTEIKQTINVDVKSIDIGEFMMVGGPYTLQEGDIILYNITAEGKGYLNAYFSKADDNCKECLGISGLTSNSMTNSTFTVTKSLAGMYYLCIGNFDGKILDKNANNCVLNNIKGTVKIAVESS